MTWEDYDQVQGWPAKATRVTKTRNRGRRGVTWRHRKTKPLWFRALLMRGSLRQEAA